MNKTKLYITIEGTGPSVVLVPGLLGSTRYWDDLTKQLVKSGKSVIRIDLLGFGNSPKPRDSAYDFDAHCDAIESALKTVQLQKPVTLTGISMSTILVVELCRRNPGMFEYLVLYSPMIYSSPAVAKRNAYRTGNMPSFIAHGPIAWTICHSLCRVPVVARPVYRFFLRNKVNKHIAEDAVLHTWHSYARTFRNIIINQNISDYVKNIEIPVKVVYGEKDISTERAFLLSLQEQNKNIQLTVVNAEHHPVLEQPEIAFSVYAT